MVGMSRSRLIFFKDEHFATGPCCSSHSFHIPLQPLTPIWARSTPCWGTVPALKIPKWPNVGDAVIRCTLSTWCSSSTLLPVFWLRKALAPEKEQQSSHPFISLHVELVLSTRFPASIRTKERSNTKIFSTHKCRLSQSASLLFSDTGGPWERGRQEFWRGMQLSRGPLNIGFRTKCKVLVWPFLRILVLNRFTCNS
jgi:hypothetical protein